MGNPATEVNSPAFSEETLIAAGNAPRSDLQQVIPTTEDPNATMQSYVAVNKVVKITTEIWNPHKLHPLQISHRKDQNVPA